MTLNTFDCKYLTPLHYKRLTDKYPVFSMLIDRTRKLSIGSLRFVHRLYRYVSRDCRRKIDTQTDRQTHNSFIVRLPKRNALKCGVNIQVT